MFERNKNNQTNVPKSEPVKSNETAAGHPGSSLSAKGNSGGVQAIIGASIRIRGDISGNENLRIDGLIEGTVNLPSHELTIGQSGKVVADIMAKSIRIQGDVEGDITGREYVVITSTSNVRGNVVTPRMTLEDGAKFKGNIDIDPEVHASKASNIESAVKKLTDVSSRDDRTGSMFEGKTG